MSVMFTIRQRGRGPAEDDAAPAEAEPPLADAPPALQAWSVAVAPEPE